MLSLLILAAAAPTAQQVAGLEESRVLTPLASQTKSPKRYIIEFAPAVETRNVLCEELKPSRYACRFESRVKGFFEREFGDWQGRKEIVVQTRRGWRFEEKDRP